MQLVNSTKRLVFDLTKIRFLKRLISISRLIVEVLNDQNLFKEIGFRLMSSFVQAVISQNELKLLGRVENETPEGCSALEKGCLVPLRNP